VAYFEQDQANALDLEATVLETMERAADETAYEGLRALLGRFMFKVRGARLGAAGAQGWGLRLGVEGVRG
jgi:ATPase subunit of ABC transporter with duplicated ATPase domains